MIRVQRYLSDALNLSRRDADELVEQGRVSVNGHPVEPGAVVDPEKDRVQVDGETVHAHRERIYLMMHKPRGVMCSERDPEGRKTVFHMLPDLPVRVHTIGRLDFLSEGLLLLTNDGDLTSKLTHPSGGFERVYEVKIQGTVPDWAIERMTKGIKLDDGMARAADVRRLQRERTRSNQWVSVTLTEGRYREVRRMFQTLGMNVLKLKRVRFGPLRLGTMPIGAVRALTPDEVQGLVENRAAGPDPVVRERPSRGGRPPAGPDGRGGRSGLTGRAGRTGAGGRAGTAPRSEHWDKVPGRAPRPVTDSRRPPRREGGDRPVGADGDRTYAPRTPRAPRAGVRPGAHGGRSGPGAHGRAQAPDPSAARFEDMVADAVKKAAEGKRPGRQAAGKPGVRTPAARPGTARPGAARPGAARPGTSRTAGPRTAGPRHEGPRTEGPRTGGPRTARPSRSTVTPRDEAPRAARPQRPSRSTAAPRPEGPRAPRPEGPRAPRPEGPRTPRPSRSTVTPRDEARPERRSESRYDRPARGVGPTAKRAYLGKSGRSSHRAESPSTSRPPARKGPGRGGPRSR